MDYREDPLDKLLDSESDEEFGEPVIRDSNHHHAREDVDGNLKSWTAEDFASIYHRFRPHLVRHARRYLSNETQAEEVVQDAFLFLMTALPEIDNELGVLKFLKWKIKYLSLDLIRAESKSTNLEPNNFDQPSDDAPVDEEILRADDAAVIRMALAKLNPRHREALMASVNEEKTSQQLAQELGTNENAARQLVFRARQAFKKALLGDIDTTGLTTNAIISIAIRKASAEARENATKVGGFILVLALGAFGLAQLPIQSAESNVSAQSTPPVVEFEVEDQVPAAPKDPLASASEDAGEAITETNRSAESNEGSSEAELTVATEPASQSDSIPQAASPSENQEQSISETENAITATMFQAENRQASYSLEDLPGVGQRISVYSTSGMIFDFLLSYDQVNEEFVILDPSFKSADDSVFQIVSFASTFQNGTRSGSLTAAGEISVSLEGQASMPLRFTYSGELDRLGQPISASIFIS